MKIHTKKILRIFAGMAINYSKLIRDMYLQIKGTQHMITSETKTTKAYLNQKVQSNIKWRCLKVARTKWRMNTKDPP